MENKKIFIACPITKYLDESLLIQPSYENFIKTIYSLCKEQSDRVFLALEREKYGKALMEGHECTFYDYREMQESHIVVALPEDSMGVAVELGWASAMNKEIFLILDEDYPASPLVQCLDAVSSTVRLKTPSRKKNPQQAESMIYKELKQYLKEKIHPKASQEVWV